tara:strand:+ start:166 stop:351 length:186 start_codon:yes stop_codon:yes gene_type:complete
MYNDYDYANAMTKAAEHRRKGRAWERAGKLLRSAEIALAKAHDIEGGDDIQKVTKRVGNWE